MSDTLAGTTAEAISDAPDYPMERAGGCPFAPPPEVMELAEARPLSRVKIWDGSTPWLITGYEEARSLFADSRVSVDDRRARLPALERGHAVHGAQAAPIGLHRGRRGAHPVSSDAVKTVHVQAS